MAGKLDGKVCLIVGAATGIGKETAHVLASHGGSVIVADIDEPGAEAVAKVVQAENGRALAVGVDITSEDSVRAMVDQVLAAFGRIDVLHNNAAAQGEAQRAGDRDLVNLDMAAFDRAIAVNLRGPVLCCKQVIPHMIAGGGGSIIHSGSGMGLVGEQTLTAYGASKAGLITLSKYIATQYGKQNVRSNALAIGAVMSERALADIPDAVRTILEASHLTPHLGTPRHIADAVAFLASDESAFITGSTFVIDGGFSAHVASFAQMSAYFAEVGSNRL